MWFCTCIFHAISFFCFFSCLVHFVRVVVFFARLCLFAVESSMCWFVNQTSANCLNAFIQIWTTEILAFSFWFFVVLWLFWSIEYGHMSINGTVYFRREKKKQQQPTQNEKVNPENQPCQMILGIFFLIAFLSYCSLSLHMFCRQRNMRARPAVALNFVCVER